MKITIAAIALCALAFATTAGAQVTLNNNPDLTMVRAESTQNQCSWIYGQQSNVPDGGERIYGRNVDCLIEPLNVPVYVGPEGGAIRVDVELTGPQSFVIQVHAAWDTAGRSRGFREQWGGYSPKTGVPSHLTVEIVR